MHDPIGPNPLRGSASVVNQRLLHSDGSTLAHYPPIFPRRLPVPRSGRSVRSESIRILSIPRPEKVPLWVSAGQEGFLYMHSLNTDL